MVTDPDSIQDSAQMTAVAKAADKHGISLTTSQAHMGAEWRNAMVNSVAAVRRIDVDGYEPAAVFTPVTISSANRGG